MDIQKYIKCAVSQCLCVQRPWEAIHRAGGGRGYIYLSIYPFGCFSARNTRWWSLLEHKMIVVLLGIFCRNASNFPSVDAEMSDRYLYVHARHRFIYTCVCAIMFRSQACTYEYLVLVSDRGWWIKRKTCFIDNVVLSLFKLKGMNTFTSLVASLLSPFCVLFGSCCWVRVCHLLPNVIVNWC